MTDTQLPNFSQVKPTGAVKLNKLVVAALVLLGVGVGLILGQKQPSSNTAAKTAAQETPGALKTVSTDSITDPSQLEIGKMYGSNSPIFKDKATGIIEKGGINGVGTHTLKRAGGVTQNAALTSSILDLDLFVGKTVEVTGETNASNKAGWFLDIGSIKITQ